MSLNEKTLAVSPYNYVGGELELFEKAVTWKSYFHRCLQGYLHGRVLEVGAGFGGTTRILCREPARPGKDGPQTWTALEPDAELLVQFRQRMQRNPYPLPIELLPGTTADLLGKRRFDSLLYIDVLEHIENDAEELERAADLLEPGGMVVVLSPAHQWLFTPFDAAIGHYRRYSARDLRALTPGSLRLHQVFYLDSVGMLASLANRLMLRQQMPTPRQIQVWDRYFVPVSRWLDLLFGYSLGKTVVGVWRKP
jgi:2-polyprenyl-3-methyl-5-hydroxy-6-metoxy-1,4-benzoquinol methylase